MHCPVVQRHRITTTLARGCISLCFALCSCAQSASPPPGALAGAGSKLIPPPPPSKAAAGPTLTVAAHDATTSAPVDATPSPDGKRIYYLAVAHNGDDEPSAGVFAVDTAAAGSGEIQQLALGAPLLTPLGVESSLDGKQLYIADTAAGDDNSGGLYSLPIAGGEPTLVPGTAGYRPAGVVVADQRGEETLYFTGREPGSGVGALYRIASAGGEATRIATFDADSEPGGVTLSAAGDLYVADHAAGVARVLRVRGADVSTFISGVGLGFPAGIALTGNDQTLLVSGLDVETKHDVVYAVNVADAKIARVTMGIDSFSESAGLHRAHAANVFAWADSQADGSGTVYSVKF